MLPFANLEAVVNSHVLNHLANVQVAIAGAVVPGIFRKPAAEAQLGVGVATTAPTVTVASNAVMAEPVGKQIEIGVTRYVIGDVAPDGTGLTVLILEEVR